MTLMKTWARVAAVLALFGTSAAMAQQAYTAKTVNLRAGPDRSYPVVVTLGPGTPLDVHGCVDGYRWCDVSQGDVGGWVYAGNITSPYQGQPVPLLGYGAAIGLPVIAFSLGSYWDSHYRGRPFYRERDRWLSRPPPRPVFRPPPRPDRPGFNRPGFDRPGFDRPRPQPPFVRPPGGRPGGDARPPGGGRPGGDARPPGGRPGGDARPPGGGRPGGDARPPGGGRPGGDARPPGGGRSGGDARPSRGGGGPARAER